MVQNMARAGGVFLISVQVLPKLGEVKERDADAERTPFLR